MTVVEMVDLEATLLREIADRRVSQEGVGLTYAFGLVGAEDVNWARVNAAILEHRSPAALRNIKKIAWRRVGERQRGGVVLRRHVRTCMFCGGGTTVLAPEGASDLDVEAEFASAGRSFGTEDEVLGVACHGCARRRQNGPTVSP